MSVSVTNHLNFRGDARAALEFYRSIFGGELNAVTYEQAHNVQDPTDADRIMWGQVAAENGFRIMAYDVPAAMPWDQGQNSYFVSVRGTDADEIGTYWEGLSEGASIRQPLGPAAWSPLYGMLQDRFGVVWILDVIAEH